MKLAQKISGRNGLFVILFFANGFSNFVQFAASLLLARQLGPQDFGEFSFFVSVAQSLSLLIDLGLCATMVRLASGKTEASDQWLMIQTTVYVQAGIYGLVLLTLLPSSALFLEFFNQDSEHHPMFFLAIAMAGVIAIQLILKSIMQVRQHVLLLAAFTATYAVSRCVFFVLAYMNSNQDIAVFFLALYLAPLILTCAVFFLLTRRFQLSEKLPLKLRSYRKSTQELLHYGKWMIAQPLYSLLYLIPIFILSQSSSYELGMYSAAVAFAAIFTLINTSIRQITMPIVSRYTTSTEINHYIGLVKGKTLMYIVCAVGIVLVMGCLMVFALDDRYSSALPVFLVLGGGMAATILLGQFNIISHVYRRPDLLLKMTALELLFVAVFCYVAVAHFNQGAFGAAVAVVSTIFIGEVWLFNKLYSMRKDTNCQIPQSY